MSAPREIIELIDRFDLHAEPYRSGRYNETQLRRPVKDESVVLVCIKPTNALYLHCDRATPCEALINA
jgi:hypothetical protein